VTSHEGSRSMSESAASRGILGQWGPVAVQDDKEDKASSDSFVLPACAGRTSSRIFDKAEALPWGSVSVAEDPVVTGTYWDG
jgi:hypothetical protein